MFEGPIAFEKPSIVRVRRLATSFGDSSANRVSRAVELARYIRGALEDVELYGIDVFDTDDPGIILAFGALLLNFTNPFATKNKLRPCSI